jgi:alpha-L-fucosidase
MEKNSWFNEARFGMFIHWGAYAVAGRGEWVLNRERIPKQEYTEKYVNNFKAQRFDPAQWVQVAKAAGMKYMVLTTRHHDGFALWNTKTTDFNAVRLGPKRDLIAEFADAVRGGGLKLGFYLSAADWSHPDYPTPFARDWPGDNDWKDDASRQRFIAYYHEQARELLTNYGKVDVLWWDGCIPGNIDGEKINKEAYVLQPHILINERNGKPFDFRNSEQTIRPAPTGQVWEACMTLNDSWGYNAGDKNWKSPRTVLEMLLTTAAGAGNLLLNMGPRADGIFVEESVSILKDVGAWLSHNNAFLSNSDRNPFGWNNWGKVTVKGNQVYLHIFNDTRGDLCWSELKNKVLSAKFLSSGKEIVFRQENDRLFLVNLPHPLPDTPISTIVLEVEGKPQPFLPQTTFWIPG